MVVPSVPTITGDLKALDDRVRTLELAGREYYDQSKTGYVLTQGVDTDFGAWSSATRFTGTAQGVTVPRQGIYLATLLLTAPTASFTGRTFLRLLMSGTQVAENDPDSVGNTGISVTGFSFVPAGGLILPMRYTAPTTMTCTVRFIIASL